MELKELEEIMEKDVGGNWEGDNAFEGLKILSKYTYNLIQGASHATVYSMEAEQALKKGLTKEDAIKLRAYNWMIEDDYFACFV